MDIINSGESLYAYLIEKGIYVDHVTAINTSENCIYLPDKTTFNWKQSKSLIRINCKENAKKVIEQAIEQEMIYNGLGDKIRPFSLLIDSEEMLTKVINALRSIEGNGIK